MLKDPRTTNEQIWPMMLLKLLVRPLKNIKKKMNYKVLTGDVHASIGVCDTDKKNISFRIHLGTKHRSVKIILSSFV